MKIVVYWARAEGAHPRVAPSMSEQVWPVMHRRVKALGYDLTLLTAAGERIDLPHDHRIDFNVDAELCALAREQAWTRYLESHLGAGEQVTMIEPDCYLCSRIPEIANGFDLVLFWRDRPPAPTCFRIARKSALPYYKRMLEIASSLTPQQHVWGCDITAQHKLTKNPSNYNKRICGARVEQRHYRHYCMPDNRSKADAVAWMFNGPDKLRMLALP
jgi:hypothetical protein